MTQDELLKMGLEAAEKAYIQMLQMPDDNLRMSSQDAFCALRDFIAATTNETEQDVQDDCEYRALEMRLKRG